MPWCPQCGMPYLSELRHKCILDTTTLTVTGHGGKVRPMVGKTAAERKAAERARRSKEGLVRVEFYLRPSLVPAVRECVENLTKADAETRKRFRKALKQGNQSNS